MPQRTICLGALNLTRLSRCTTAALLALLLVDQPLFAAVPDGHSTAPAGLLGDERILHALNRFTFGPRPGDVAVVRSLGLQRWFDLQLNPERLNDTELNTRMAEFPAIQLPLSEMVRQYPGPQVLRKIENGNASLPADPARRAMVEDQLAIYKKKKEAATAAKQAKADAAPAMQDGATADTMQPAVTTPPAMTPDAASAAKPAPFPRPEAMRILALEPAARVQAVMALPPDDLVRFRAALGPKLLEQLTDGLTPVQKEQLIALGGSLRMIGLETMESRVVRDLYSERQLEAVMTDFWLNHFNVYVRKSQQEPYLLPEYERTVRANALGNFETLLVATAESPAMLAYLDNFRSVGPDSLAATRVKRVQQTQPNGKIAKAASLGLNENYGRELMELHTLGVNGGYTQADVTQVAKVFTGWTIDRPYQMDQGGTGGFVFDERRHEPGDKTVLGQRIHEDGQKEGLAVLHMLATSPATAHFITQKLAVRFVADDPPPALVNRMAQTFLTSHGDIRKVLRTMFDSPEFWSPAVYRAKVKTPEEFIFSAVRAGDVAVTNPVALVQSLDKLAMPLYGMQTPNGYSWKQDEWVSTGALVSRMNFALVLSGGRLPGTRPDWAGLLDEAESKVEPVAYTGDQPVGDKERRLETLLIGQPVSDRTRAAVLGQAENPQVTEQAATQFDLRGDAGKKGGYRVRGMEAGPAAGQGDDTQAQVIAGLLLGSPEFQRR